MSELRRQRIESAILREVSTYIHSLDDKLLNEITVTHVEVTDDFHYARIYYTVLGHEQEKEEIASRLKRASRRIQRDLAERLKTMRYVPLLSFHFDLSLQRGDRVLKMLDEIEEELKRGENNEQPT